MYNLFPGEPKCDFEGFTLIDTQLHPWIHAHQSLFNDQIFQASSTASTEVVTITSS